jgi:transposase
MRGSRPSLLKDQRFGYAYIFGAVCPSKDKGAGLVLPYANTEMMNLHLEEISLHVDATSHAVLLMDGAGWHTEGGELIVPDNLTIVHIPPYSPELNSQENVWQFLRNNYLNNRVFDDYDAIVEACSSAWKKLLAETGRIKSIAARPWIDQVSI